MGFIKRNIIANIGGRAWSNLIGLLFIPVYLHFLGINLYGLVGFWITLASVLSILDFGLGLTLTRETARLSTNRDNSELLWDTLRSFEVIYWTMSFLVGGVIWISAPLIANHWLSSTDVAVGTVIRSIRIMALVFLFQFPFALYQGGLLGLQRQVLASGIQAGFGSLRGILASTVLWLFSPTIEAFFYCQLAVSLLQTIFTAAALRIKLPPASRRPVFRISVCKPLLGYASGVSGNTIIGLFLTQMDKVILSKMLTLDKFGYYTLSWTVASALWTLIQPFNQALFPRFAQLFEEKDDKRLAELYHRTCQFASAILLPVAMTLAVFSRDIVFIWTRDPVVAENTHLIVTLLVVGTALNGLASIPGSLQFAAGWPQLLMYTNLVAAVILGPLIFFLSKLYGGIGASAAWVLLNTGYMFTNVPLMHRRFLRGELWRWYIYDLLRPLMAASLTGLIFWLASPAQMSVPGKLCLIGIAFVTCQLICVIQSKIVRRYVLTKLLNLKQAER